jgi:hypothetical protein
MNRLKIEELKEIEDDVHKYRHDCLSAVGEEEAKGALLKGNAREGMTSSTYRIIYY